MSARVRKILIVDDEENVLSALRRSLRREQDYHLSFASQPKEALAKLAEAPVDLVLSDHLMPNMTGLEFLKLVRLRYPDSMRLMLTGHADMQTAISAINQGEIYRFLTKPWDDTELKVTLHLAFEQLDLARENRRLLTMLRNQQHFIEKLERQHPGIGRLRRDENGAIIIDDEAPAAQVR